MWVRREEVPGEEGGVHGEKYCVRSSAMGGEEEEQGVLGEERRSTR